MSLQKMSFCETNSSGLVQITEFFDSPCDSYNDSDLYCKLDWSSYPVSCGTKTIFDDATLTDSYTCSDKNIILTDSLVFNVKSSCTNNCSTNILVLYTENQNNGDKIAIKNSTTFTINNVYLMSSGHSYCQQTGPIESEQVVQSTWTGTDSNYLWGSSLATKSSNC